MTESAHQGRGNRAGGGTAKELDWLPAERADATPPMLPPPKLNFAAEPDHLSEPAGKARLSGWIEQELDQGAGFLLLPVALGLGAILWFTAASRPSLFLVATALPLLLASLILRWTMRRWLSVAAFLTGSIFLGMASAAWEEWRLSTIILDSAVTTTVEGVVERREATGQSRWRYVLEIRGTTDPVLTRPPTRATLTVRGKREPFHMGDVLQGKARLSPPSGPPLAGLGDFAFASYFDGIGATGFFFGTPQKIGIAEEAGLQYGWLNSLYDLRSYVGDRIRTLVEGDKGAFAAAIITDERRAISGPVLDALREAGLAHIVAISGLNMALAAGIFFVGARALLVLIPGISQRISVKKAAAFGALLMVTAYYLISGFGVSAERAYIMMVVMLMAVLVDRPSISLHNIALAAIIILVLHPSSVMGASFQMSFGATAALVAGYNLWSKRKQNEDGFQIKGPQAAVVTSVAGFVGGTVMTSLIGGLSTAIFSIAHFNQLSAYGLVANLAAMPFISVIVMPAGLLGMLAMPFGLDALFFAIMGWGLDVVISVATVVASWDGGTSIGRAPPYFLAITSFGLILFISLRSPLRWLGAVLLTAGLILLFSGAGRARPEMVVAEDGEAILLRRGSVASTNQARSSGFLFERWRNALQITDTILPVRRSIDLAGDDEPSINALADGDEETPVLSNIRSDRKRLTTAQIKSVEAAMATGLSEIKPDQFFCLTRLICMTITAEGSRIAAVSDNRLLSFACDHADFVVSSRTRFSSCRSGARLLTGTTLRTTGTMEIVFGGHFEPGNWAYLPSLNSSARAWEIHRTYDWRARSFAIDAHDDPIQRWLNGNGE
ncbi:ComEC/Rec2 family competence protein [Rhizobium helianthi]|uniref:ComEC/Rec2 family competence protein n=1 Tax=Rhizobium helianthi TaxID=1132695 RepID=A0ABW4LZ94_9HYPH